MFLFVKRWSNFIAVANIANRMRNAYLRPANIDVSVKRLRNFRSREDGMLIIVLHQEKGYGSKKLLAEYPNKPFELYQRNSLGWKLAFSVLVLKDKKISLHKKRSSLKFYK